MVPVEWTSSRPGPSLLSNVVSIAPPETPKSSQLGATKRRWELKASLAVAVLGAIAFAFLVRTAVIGHFKESRPNFSQRRLTANPYDAPLTSGVISPMANIWPTRIPPDSICEMLTVARPFLCPCRRILMQCRRAGSLIAFTSSCPILMIWKRSLPAFGKYRSLGGTPRKLADVGLSARVSPDGSRIVFLKGKWDDEEIWLIDTDKNTTSKIVDGGGDHFGPVAWAPDGKRFACVRMPDRFSAVGLGMRIEVFDATTGKGEMVLSDFRPGTAIAWPDNGRLIYASQEVPPNDGNFNLWWVHVDSRTGRTSGSATRITNDQTPIAGISVTSDGKRIVLLRQEFQTDVYLAELSAQGKRLSALRRFTLDDRDDLPSAWTPDSKAVLFVSNRDGPNHIFRQSIDATHPDLLVGGKDNLGPPQLTPDGLSALYLVFPSSGKPSDNSRLMRIPLSGGSSQLALEEPGIGNYKCAHLPSILCIYSRIDHGQQRFFTFDPTAGKGRELLAAKWQSDDGPGSVWSLSPDGRYLASPRSANPYEASGLRILDLIGGTERDISVSGLPLIMGMDWAPDSRSLWLGGYMGRSSGGSRSGLLRVDLMGRVSTELEGSSMAIWFAVPSPDGRRVAVLAHTDNSNVSLLENF
jgi:Tol biopolymer transport system component